MSVGHEWGSYSVVENYLKSHKQSIMGNGRTHWHLGFQCILVALPWADLFCLWSFFLHYNSLTGERQVLCDLIPLPKPLGQPHINTQWMDGWVDGYS